MYPNLLSPIQTLTIKGCWFIFKYQPCILAGWWYNYCAYALLNGLYYQAGPYTPSGGYYDGIYWKDWLGYGYSLRFTRMMLSRP